jgi:hypothetical protein
MTIAAAAGTCIFRQGREAVDARDGCPLAAHFTSLGSVDVP